MKRHSLGAWKYFWNADSRYYSIYPAKLERHPKFPKGSIAELCSRDLETREADAQLIVSVYPVFRAIIEADVLQNSYEQV